MTNRDDLFDSPEARSWYEAEEAIVRDLPLRDTGGLHACTDVASGTEGDEGRRSLVDGMLIFFAILVATCAIVSLL